MQPSKKEQAHRDDDGKKPKTSRFDATLPMSMGKPGQNADAPRNADGELDLDLGDVQTRLPYGSEDIADK